MQMNEYYQIEGLKNVDALFFGKVEDAAKGLTPEEVLTLFNMTLDKLNEIEQEWFHRAFNRGRAAGKKDAVDRLFASMLDKGGKDAALAYLVRFADSWQKEAGDLPKEGTFKFEVKL